MDLWWNLQFLPANSRLSPRGLGSHPARALACDLCEMPPKHARKSQTSGGFWQIADNNPGSLTCQLADHARMTTQTSRCGQPASSARNCEYPLTPASSRPGGSPKAARVGRTKKVSEVVRVYSPIGRYPHRCASHLVTSPPAERARKSQTRHHSQVFFHLPALACWAATSSLDLPLTPNLR
jgi:hypothetical protein